MAKAKKLPSGKWRVLMYDQTGIDGKRKYKSFTADTKSEAERIANAWKYGKGNSNSSITVIKTMEEYIKSKENLLSPATVRNKNKLIILIKRTSIANVKICNLTTLKVQAWISELSEKYSYNTILAFYRSFITAVHQQDPDLKFKITFPPKNIPVKHTPSSSDIKLLMENANPTLRLAILLCVGGNGALRRGEICAIKQRDIDRVKNTINIHADIVITNSGKYVYKNRPKNNSSIRTVTYSPEVIAQIPHGNPEDFVINVSPNSLTMEFAYIRKKLGLDFRFHDLRAYSASIMITLGIPEIYIEKYGGWTAGSSSFRSLYSRVLKEYNDQYIEKATNEMKNIVICNTNATRNQ